MLIYRKDPNEFDYDLLEDILDSSDDDDEE